MLYLALIYHMHQPYYKNLLTNEAELPWVRLHGTKDYLDMVEILQNYPLIRQTFNLVPSLLEQIEDYANNNIKDKFLDISYKPADQLTDGDKHFLLEHFFMINKDGVIAFHPRYYDLYFKKHSRKDFSTQDFLDLQVWFNLAWIDPLFRENNPALKALVLKARFFTEDDKRIVLETQQNILRRIIPAYKKYLDSGQIEVTANPYYHPILPLLYNSKLAVEANRTTPLPKTMFAYPEDAQAQIDDAVAFYTSRFGRAPLGMWPSEEAVCEHIIPGLIQSGIRWIVTDEAILFKSVHAKKRDTRLLYQPHLLRREAGELAVVFRDRNLSDLIGFEYNKWHPKDAVNDFMRHLRNIYLAFGDQDVLVTIALDGENAWEYFRNDGHDFLNEFYGQLSHARFLKTTTVAEYLLAHPPTHQIKRLGAGSWIFGDFGKWMGNQYKNIAWEYLTAARAEFELILTSERKDRLGPNFPLAVKQMRICEGSDWFWWYGDRHAGFDALFRAHLANFYTLIEQPVPEYLKRPIEP